MNKNIFNISKIILIIITHLIKAVNRYELLTKEKKTADCRICRLMFAWGLGNSLLQVRSSHKSEFRENYYIS